jgi:aminoglycoside/choline kinase family phosphotransferase
MYGPLMYDVISFLFQAKANFPEDFKKEMLDYYLSFFYNKTEQNGLKESLEPMKLMRFLQVLGAYGFRGIIQRKPHFIASINTGIENLHHLSETWEGMKNFPELQKLISELKTEHTRIKIDELTKK